MLISVVFLQNIAWIRDFCPKVGNNIGLKMTLCASVL